MLKPLNSGPVPLSPGQHRWGARPASPVPGHVEPPLEQPQARPCGKCGKRHGTTGSPANGGGNGSGANGKLVELPPAQNHGQPAQRAMRAQRAPQEQRDPPQGGKPFPSHELQNLQQRMSELQMMESSINGYLAQSGSALEADIIGGILFQVFEAIEDAYFSADVLHLYTTGEDCPDCMKGDGDACPFEGAMEQLEKKMLFYQRMEPIWLRMAGLGDGGDLEDGTNEREREAMEVNHG